MASNKQFDIFSDPDWASKVYAQHDALESRRGAFFEGVDDSGFKGTVAGPIVGPVGPAASVEYRVSPDGVRLIGIGGIGVGASGQFRPSFARRFGFRIGVGEIGPTSFVLQATGGNFVTGTGALHFSVSPLGARFTGKLGFGGGGSAIVGVQKEIRLV